MIDLIATKYTYLVVVALLAIGAYVMIESDNFVKKIIGLNLFQTGIFVFFISAAFLTDGASPVVQSGGGGPFVSPLPHVLILTAIVVGVSLTAVALGLIVRIYESYGTINEDTLEEVLAND
mgnify:CR=1 FL=1